MLCMPALDPLHGSLGVHLDKLTERVNWFGSDKEKANLKKHNKTQSYKPYKKIMQIYNSKLVCMWHM